MMRILVIGPSPENSKGGMATVIKEIRDDNKLVDEFQIDIYESFIDGNKITRIIFSIVSFLRFYFTKRNYDVYHIHAASRGSTFRKGYYLKVIKKWGKKAIIHIHGAQYMEFYKNLSIKKKNKVIEILKTADMVIALSQEWKNKFDKTFGLTNCVILKNGINENKLSSAITEPSIYQHNFLALGRLGKRKGTYDLIDAIEIAKDEVSDIKVYLAGDGDVDEVKKRVKQKKLTDNVKVVGWVDLSGKLKLLKNVTTVVLPSYNEGLPMSILEGMACGKVIVSTTVGAIPEVVDSENGILIHPGNINNLAEALVKCCTDLNYCESASKVNIKKIKKDFSMTSIHEKLGLYYNSLK